jgi:hypothetical protein
MESENNVTTFTDSIVFDVIKDIANRAEVGLKKYNTTMDREDLTASDWVQHAYEECLDMALYLKRLHKDMLAMEEELLAFKKDKEDFVFERKTGTTFAYTLVPKPNETYTDLEKKPRA